MKEEKKSSKEILSELFDKFNATPPSSPSIHSVDNDNVNEETVKKKDNKKSKKEDKDKSKHKKKKKKEEKEKKKEKLKKHKDKKSKKKKKRRRRRSGSSDCTSDSDSNKSEAETKSSKKVKRGNKTETSDAGSSKVDITIGNVKKERRVTVVGDGCKGIVVETPNDKANVPKLNIKIEHQDSVSSKSKTDSLSNLENKTEPSSVKSDETFTVVLPDVVPTTCKVVPSSVESVNVLIEESIPQVADIFVEELLESSFAAKSTSILEKPKANIKILDLKKCNILELAEQKQREKAEKYEEGEITSDSSEGDNDALPTLQPVEPEDACNATTTNLDEKVKKEKTKSCHRKKSHKSRKRSRSGSRDRKSSRSKDLRLKINDSKTRDWRSRSRSRGRRKRRSSSSDRKWDKDDKYRDKEKKSHRRERSNHKRRKEERSDKEKKEHDKKDSKDLKEKSSKERRSKSRERRKNKSRSPLQLPSMILQDNPNKKKRSRSRSRNRLEIDKKKLLEIARKNALSMLKQQGSVVANTDSAKVATITAGGKTVDELTDFCKQLSQKEGKDDAIELSPITESSEDEGEKAFHHPFLIKDRPTNIVMNIRNCSALPVKTHQEKTAEAAAQLRLQFPVSSGQHHRKTENEWVPVEPKKDEPATAKPLKVGSKPVAATPVAVESSSPLAIEPPPLPPAELVSVFPSVEEPLNINIGDVVGQKLAATKRLQGNPADYAAMKLLRDAEDKLSRWNEANQLQQPGLFTGSTGARLLTPAELASGQQAWAKKDQLMCAQPVTGGIGSHLLQKMGWKPGEGLGKNHEGTLEPLSLPLKMDKKGLVCAEEVKRPPRFINNMKQIKKQTVKSLEGKHPVSLLLEYCSKRHLNPPIFNVCFESGPSHKRSFLFKVEVNGVEYEPPAPSNNKKLAKSEAAVVCLRALGLMPSTTVPTALLHQ